MPSSAWWLPAAPRKGMPMANKADRDSRRTRRAQGAADRSAAAGAERGHLFTLFQGDHVPAAIMGPRLLVAVSALALTILGIVMVYSSSSIEAITESGDSTYYLIRQLGFAVVGALAAFAAVKFVPYQSWLNRLGMIYYVVCMALVVLTAVMGLVGLGAQRWLSIGGVTLQPSEFAKIALILATTRFMLEWRAGSIDTRAFLIRMGVFVIIPLVFIFRMQSDLGTTVICLVGILTILWVGEVPLKVFIGLIALVFLFAAASSTVGYRQDRWIFLNPWSDYYGSGFQVIHSFYAFAQGGLFGKGLGNSAEKYLYLPEAETDFIFSIIGEELGFIGAFAVVALFIAFLIGGLRMAQQAPDDAGRLLCSSLTIMLVFQAFLNMAMCLGLAPTTGKPLPFISAGGSSLIASLLIVGIMLSVSYSTDDAAYARKRENLRLLRVEGDGETSDSGPRRRGGPSLGARLQAGLDFSVGDRTAGPARSGGQGSRRPDAARAGRGDDRSARTGGGRSRRTAAAGRTARTDRPDRGEGRSRGEGSPNARRADRSDTGRSRTGGGLPIVNDYHVPNRTRSTDRNPSERRSGRRK